MPLSSRFRELLSEEMKQVAGERVMSICQELDPVLEQATRTPLSDPDYQKLKEALARLAWSCWTPAHATPRKQVRCWREHGQRGRRLTEQATTNKRTRANPDTDAMELPLYQAQNIAVSHAQLKPGIVARIVTKAKYMCRRSRSRWCASLGKRHCRRPSTSLERLRCNGCGQVFTAQEPEGIGPEKYDETTGAMIAQLKYGSGVPFYRLEKLQENLGIPMPAATQWEIVEEAAEIIKPAQEELIRQAAQGEVLHNDDTSMRVLRLAREPSDKRTGVFTSGIVATGQGQKIALFFTGRQHAGENLADVLQQRAAELRPPIQMCDALSRNLPKLPTGWKS